MGAGAGAHLGVAAERLHVRHSTLTSHTPQDHLVVVAGGCDEAGSGGGVDGLDGRALIVPRDLREQQLDVLLGGRHEEREALRNKSSGARWMERGKGGWT